MIRRVKGLLAIVKFLLSSKHDFYWRLLFWTIRRERLPVLLQMVTTIHLILTPTISTHIATNNIICPYHAEVFCHRWPLAQLWRPEALSASDRLPAGFLALDPIVEGDHRVLLHLWGWDLPAVGIDRPTAFGVADLIVFELLGCLVRVPAFAVWFHVWEDRLGKPVVEVGGLSKGLWS